MNLERLVKNKRYVPDNLTQKDKVKQIISIILQQKRPIIKSYKSKTSKWTTKAKRFFKGDMSLENISKTIDVPIRALQKIINKGKGAYFSSGSRPNQTPESWGRARLYSVLFNGRSREIDKDIVNKYKIPLLK